jgi:hypothetical protein
MGKGSRPRPFSVTQKEYSNSFDTIFGVKPPKERWVPPPLPVDEKQAKDTDKESK